MPWAKLIEAEAPEATSLKATARPNDAAPNAEPVGTEAPRAAPPEMFDEIPDGLNHDDLLEERLCKKLMSSLKRVHIHHKVMFFLGMSSTFISCLDVFVMTCHYHGCAENGSALPSQVARSSFLDSYRSRVSM